MTLPHKQLTAFEAPSVKAMLVPVNVRYRNDYSRPLTLCDWNARVKRWHRTGGQP